MLSSNLSVWLMMVKATTLPIIKIMYIIIIYKIFTHTANSCGKYVCICLSIILPTVYFQTQEEEETVFDLRSVQSQCVQPYNI